MSVKDSNTKDNIRFSNQVRIAVVYDNHRIDEKLKTGWGFSAVITACENKILFDTGNDADSLLKNMAGMGIASDDIDRVVISHHHADHTGGLAAVLDKNPDVTVYLPAAFAARARKSIKQRHNKIIEVKNSKEICDNVHLIRQRGIFVSEQFLAIQTMKGIVLCVGCGHPGIVKIIQSAEKLLKDNVLLVVGCFHLEWAFRGKIERIIEKFRKINVRYIGPCHGTSDKARELLKKHFASGYIDAGAGRIINVSSLD